MYICRGPEFSIFVGDLTPDVDDSTLLVSLYDVFRNFRQFCFSLVVVLCIKYWSKNFSLDIFRTSFVIAIPLARLLKVL
jgi:hypothetical protein